MTNEQLAELIKEEVGGLKVEVSDLKKIVDRLEEGAFSKDEKEDVLAMVRHINQRLEDEALGKKSITLTREEYNGIAEIAGFENKFEKIRE